MKLSKFLLENVKSMSFVNESVNIRDISKAIDRIEGYLYKRGIYPYPFQIPLSKDGKTKFGVLMWTDKNTGACFCWDRSDSANIDSILFTSNFDETLFTFIDNQPTKWDVSLECKGASMVRLVQLVSDVLTGKTPMNPKAIQDSIHDAQIWESMMEDEELMGLITESKVDDLIRQKNNLYQRIRDAKKKGKDVADLETQYEDLKIQIESAKGLVRGGVITKPQSDPEIDKLEDQFEEEVKASPEERFSDMESYINKVIIGFKPLAVICGAPGVGKTYRIMKAIQSFGKQKGQDYGLIKGKSTAANLYMTFHDYKEPGQLVVIDDADEVVKDDVAINLIKAACDSSDERWVSWGTARPPEMSEEKAMMCDDAIESNGKFFYPKEFEMKGGLIIITNMNAGALDTAIKNRGLLCDLNFTTSEILDIVRDIAPKIMPNILPDAAKEKALNYLQELADKGAPVEISIRSFSLIAGLYMDDAPEEAIQRRIREQMKLQFSRNKKKY